MIDNIEVKGKQYRRQSNMITSSLFIIAMVVNTLTELHSEILHPAMVGAIFNIIIASAISVIWMKVASSNESMLTTFYMATNGFRMLLALAIMTGCYFVVGRESMTCYVLVFMVFYLFAVGHHAWYFSRITKNSN